MARLNNFFTLDISNHAVEVIGCRRNIFSRLVLTSINRAVLDNGIIVNGVIKNPNALLKTIKKVLNTAKPKPITYKTCLLSVPENRMFTNIFTVPSTLKDSEIEQFLLMQAEGIIPFNKDTMYSDYRVVESAEAQKKILYVAAPRQLIDDILAILSSLGINVQVIELESLALARCLLPPFSNRKAAVVIVDIGSYFSNIAIYDHEGMKETVSLPVAGSHFTEVFRKKGKLTLEQALEIKEKEGCYVKDEKIAKGLKELLDKILQEISRSIKYYEQKNNRQVKKIVLTGGSTEMVGLLQYFEEKLKIEVQKGDPWLHLKSKKNIILSNVKKTDVNTFATVIGLLLRGMRKKYKRGINILPSQKQKASFANFKSCCREEWPKIIILFLIIVCLVSIFVFRDNIKIDKKSNQQKNNFVISQQSFKFTIDYQQQAVTNFDQSIIRGKLINSTYEFNYELADIKSSDLVAAAENYVTLINQTDREKRIVANSRISQDGVNIYYLADDQVIPARGKVLAEINTTKNLNPLLPGRYNFVALSGSQRESIYAEKIATDSKWSLRSDDPALKKKVDDQRQMGIMRAWSEYRTAHDKEFFLPDQPVSIKVINSDFIVKDEKISLVLKIEFIWPQPEEQDWLVFFQRQCGIKCQKQGLDFTKVMIKNLNQDLENSKSLWQVFY